MADVSRDRAQLLLVTALAMAVAFVAIALTLNTAIYTENLATRSSDIAGGSDALQFYEVTVESTSELLSHSNVEHNESHTTLAKNFTDGTERLATVTGKGYAITSAVVELRNVEVTNGTKLTQNVSRNFTASDASSNWTLASGVTDTSTFVINVSNSSLNESSQLLIENGDHVFTIHVEDDDGDQWRTYVYRNITAAGTSNVNVTVERPDGTFTQPCTVSDDYAIVNFTGGKLGGNDCSEIDVFDDLSEPYSIGYNDTELSSLLGISDHPTGQGTYKLLVDNSSIAKNPEPFFNDGPGASSPQAAPILVGASFDVIYETPRTHYNASVRVTPGDAG